MYTVTEIHEKRRSEWPVNSAGRENGRKVWGQASRMKSVGTKAPKREMLYTGRVFTWAEQSRCSVGRQSSVYKRFTLDEPAG